MVIALRTLLLTGFLLASLVLAGTAQAISPPQRTGWVTDEADVIDAATETAISDRLQQLKDETGVEIVVVTLRGLQGLSIEFWGELLGETWGIGRAAGKDNGALLVVAPSARKIRIAVGYGLSKSIPDSTAQMIIDRQIVPRFRSGDLSGGIAAGAKAMTVYAEMGSPAHGLKVESDPDFSPKSKFTLTPIAISVAVMAGCVVILLILHGAHHVAVAVSSTPRVKEDDDGEDTTATAAAGTSTNIADTKTTTAIPVNNAATANDDGFWVTLLRILMSHDQSESTGSGWSPTSWSSSSSSSSGWSFGSSSSSSSHSFGSPSSSSGSHRSFGGGASGSW